MTVYQVYEAERIMDTVFDFLPITESDIERDVFYQKGEPVINMNSIKLRAFKHKGLVCEHCGFNGTHFVIQEHKESLFTTVMLNLFATNENNMAVMLYPIFSGEEGEQNNPDKYTILCDYCMQQVML